MQSAPPAACGRVRDGIRDAGGIPFEFPVHPLQESCRRPTAALDRNLAYLGMVEVMCGYPLDGVVLTTGCDKTTPACMMAAATVNLPSIVLSGGPMIDSYYKGKLAGSGMALWEARRMVAAGEIDGLELIDMVCSSRPESRSLQHHGHGAVDELARGGAGDVAARAARRSPHLTESARRWRTPPACGSWRWCMRT